MPTSAVSRVTSPSSLASLCGHVNAQPTNQHGKEVYSGACSASRVFICVRLLLLTTCLLQHVKRKLWSTVDPKRSCSVPTYSGHWRLPYPHYKLKTPQIFHFLTFSWPVWLSVSLRAHNTKLSGCIARSWSWLVLCSIILPHSQVLYTVGVAVTLLALHVVYCHTVLVGDDKMWFWTLNSAHRHHLKIKTIL